MLTGKAKIANAIMPIPWEASLKEKPVTTIPRKGSRIAIDTQSEMGMNYHLR